jgi:hypothetical protein
MTLIIAINTAEGLIVAADKRSSDVKWGIRDDRQKFYPIGSYGVVATSGMGQFVNELNDEDLFNATASVQRYMSHGVELADNIIPNIGQAIWADLTAYLQPLNCLQWPPNPPDGVLFQVILFFFSGSFKRFILRVHYQQAFPHPKVMVNILSNEHPFVNALPDCHGNPAVITEILTGNNSAFDDLRTDPQTKRFLFNPPPPVQVSVRAAIDFCQHIMIECSKRTPLIDTSGFLIGPDADIGLICPRTGFRWVVGGPKG